MSSIMSRLKPKNVKEGALHNKLNKLNSEISDLKLKMESLQFQKDKVEKELSKEFYNKRNI